MNRRALLVTTGAGLAALAGCSTFGSGPPSEPDAGDATPTETTAPEITPRYPEPTRDSDAVTDVQSERTDATVEVGETDGDRRNTYSHGVSISNAADDAKVIELRVADRAEGSVLHEGTYEMSGGGAVSLSLLEPSDYLVDVGVPDAGTGASLAIGPGRFDCNASTTHVSISEADGITAATLSTMMACPSSHDR